MFGTEVTPHNHWLFVSDDLRPWRQTERWWSFTNTDSNAKVKIWPKHYSFNMVWVLTLMACEQPLPDVCQAGQVCAVCPVSNALRSPGTNSKALCDSWNRVTDVPGSLSLNTQRKQHSRKLFISRYVQTQVTTKSSRYHACYSCMHFITARQQWSQSTGLKSGGLHHCDSTSVKMAFWRPLPYTSNLGRKSLEGLNHSARWQTCCPAEGMEMGVTSEGKSTTITWILPSKHPGEVWVNV